MPLDGNGNEFEDVNGAIVVTSAQDGKHRVKLNINEPDNDVPKKLVFDDLEKAKSFAKFIRPNK